MYQHFIATGNIGKDPDIRSSRGGSAVANFSLATNERWKNREGVSETRTEWHNCVAFGKTAEIVRDYVRKGNMLTVEGKVRNESWDDAQTGQKKYMTKIYVDRVHLFPKKFNESSGSDYHGGDFSDPSSGDSFDDDIPF